eukprot:1681477-Amphidinium_carterae.1
MEVYPSWSPEVVAKGFSFQKHESSNAGRKCAEGFTSRLGALPCESFACYNGLLPSQPFTILSGAAES